jgi:serine protease AprX
MSSEFQGRVTAFYDFTDGKTAPAYPSDAYGHGTHVAGIIGGSGALSYNRDYRGLAPSVTFTVLKVLDATGGVLERGLDRVRRQPRRVDALCRLVRFDHQRDHAAGDAGRHAGADGRPIRCADDVAAPDDRAAPGVR